jgi:hypothetical protein
MKVWIQVKASWQQMKTCLLVNLLIVKIDKHTPVPLQNPSIKVPKRGERKEFLFAF